MFRKLLPQFYSLDIAMIDTLSREKVGIVIPAYNECKNIDRIVRDCLTWCQLVVVVDDGSTDTTANVAASSGALVERHAYNAGYGVAVTTGIDRCLALRCENIVTLDGDGVHSGLEARDVFFAHTRSGADLTIGSRFCDPALASTIPTTKVSANRMAIDLFSWISPTSASDVLSGLRAYRAHCTAILPKAKRFDWVPASLAAMLRSHARIHEHPIQVKYSADEMWSTKRGEMINFMDWLYGEASPEQVQKIQQVRDALDAFLLFRVRTPNNVFVCHPIPHANSYLIQQGDASVLAGPPCRSHINCG